MYAPRQRLPAAAETADSPLLVFPSPNLSLSDVSEFTLLEGSSSSFVWSELDSPSSPVPSQPFRSRAASPAPLPAIVCRPISLLAFLASLLAIDDATRQLLEQPPSPSSPLFPGPSLAPTAPDAGTPDTQHGLFRLQGCSDF